jgi:hypothetical protein
MPTTVAWFSMVAGALTMMSPAPETAPVCPTAATESTTDSRASALPAAVLPLLAIRPLPPLTVEALACTAGAPVVA